MTKKTKPNGFWTNEKLAEEALKYETRSAFKKGNQNAYNAAIAKGLHNDEVTFKHMKNIRVKWNNEIIRDEALKYKSRVEFNKENPAAYAAASRRWMLNDGITCAHMKEFRIKWTDEMLMEEALKYESRVDFHKKSGSAYSICVRRKLIDNGITCSHMKEVPIKWTAEMIHDASLAFETRTDFKYGNPCAYDAAHRMNIINDGITCDHMNRGVTGFNPEKKGWLYYIRFNNGIDSPLYKIGITNKTPNKRIQSMCVYEGFTATVIREFFFKLGVEAMKLESEILNFFKEHKYTGNKILGNGNTELFNCDILGFDT